MLENIHFDEIRQSQLPMVEILLNLGYSYVSVDELKKQRTSDYSKHLLKDIALESLLRINNSEDQAFKFRREHILEFIDDLENIQFEGLIDTSKTVYNMIMPLAGGKTIRVFHDGRYESKSLRFIDFKKPENNSFHVAVEVVLSTSSGYCRPDIVCYVNGLPFVVVENKKSSVDVRRAVEQMIRNQGPGYTPKFFTYPQSLIGTNSQSFKYGTTGAEAEFYTRWREQEQTPEELDKKAGQLIGKAIDKEVYSRVCGDLSINSNHKQDCNRQPTEQDRSTISLLRKDRLLNIAKNFTIYDGLKKKVVRHQQFFAINKTIQRIKQIEKQSNGENRRQGGIIWHTQGSGKSLTMVMLVRALIEDPDIVNPRVIIVTDRRDLDRQILSTFQNSGLKKEVIQASSGKHLLKLIKNRDSRVITTLVHKFEAAKRYKALFVDPDQNIFVLIDEAHRTQYGVANLEMNQVIPNACYIAFTGTPLLKKDKSKQKFGSFIDKYTIDDALADEVILKLIYEGRFVNLKQDKEEIDRLTKHLMDDLDDKSRKKLQGNIKPKLLKDNPQRIAEIALDIEKHYTKNFQRTGLKAQAVAPSKYSAVMMQKVFENRGKLESALIISDENGIIDEKDEHKKEVERFLRAIKNKHSNLLEYEKTVIKDFKDNEDGIEILIVVDKLLTGFNAPRNTVLYLAKPLKDHNLLQAIARVNRIHDNPKKEKSAGYIVDYSENAEGLKKAMYLFGNYDDEDVKSALMDVEQKIEDLRLSRQALQDIFKGVPEDSSAYFKHLEDESIRQDFYLGLREYLRNFSECLVLSEFPQKCKDIDLYKSESRKFMELRKSVSLKHNDGVDLSKYRNELTKIMDVHVQAEEATLLTQPININDGDLFDKALEDVKSDKIKAEALAGQIRVLTHNLEENDPSFYKKFSEIVAEIIQSMEDDKLTDALAFEQLKLIKDKVLSKDGSDLPDKIAQIRPAGFLYRNLKEGLRLEEDLYQEVILDICKIIKENLRVDWWRNQEIQRIISNKIDDYLYDELKIAQNVELSIEESEKIAEDAVKLAAKNHPDFVA